LTGSISPYRIGFGYDTHRLVEGRPLILGGVQIPYALGLLGHSDADVLIHAIMDAVIGALGRGDIGRYFPDSDPAYKDADSMVLLKEVIGFAVDDGYRIGNLDATIVAEEPKLAPHVGTMKTRLASVLHISKHNLNIKATTSEGIGFTGRREGMAAYAVVLLQGLNSRTKAQPDSAGP
jgi:2-C-methyl-D-erythritol 2,4-cyclodiphosphate synthase